jgi:hypothetical protein
VSAPASPVPERFLLAPHHLRLFAVLLDYVIAIAGLKLAEQALLGDGWDLRLAANGPEIFPLWWVLAAAALFLTKDVFGASMGKWVMGISVRRRDAPHRHPELWRRLARNLSLLLLPLDVGQLFRDPYLRRLGDRWFGTVVIVRQPPVYIVQRAFGLGILFLGFVLAALLITSWNLHRSAAFQLAHSAVLAQPALAAHLGEPVTVDDSPSVELRVEQGMALFIFQATGKQRSAEVRVRLVLHHSPPSWSVGSIDMPAPPRPDALLRAAPASNP